MTRPMRLFVLALLAAPALTYVVYRLAKSLGFMDPPWNKEHEHRRTIIAALYAFLLLLPALLFGYANDWPRIWWIFGVVNGVAMLAFAVLGCMAAVRLWRLRHPQGDAQPEGMVLGDPPQPPDDLAGKPLS